jgi:hypothetical protein
MSVPIISYGAHKKKGYFERLQVRVAELRKRTEFLQRNLTRADECISTFSIRVTDLIERIQAEAKDITHALTATREKMKAAIDQAVKEAEATIHEDETPSISELGAWLRDPAIPEEKLSIFSYPASAQFGLLPISDSFAFWLLEPSSSTALTTVPSVYSKSTI